VVVGTGIFLGDCTQADFGVARRSPRHWNHNVSCAVRPSATQKTTSKRGMPNRAEGPPRGYEGHGSIGSSRPAVARQPGTLPGPYRTRFIIVSQVPMMAGPPRPLSC
jgi:hypothetical protein